MAAQLNVLDYAILLILAVGVLHGLTRGALRMVTPIISFVCGIYAASIWYGQVGAIVERNFATRPSTSQTAGYVIVFLLVFVAIGYAAGRIIQLAHIINLNWVDRIAGAVVGLALAAVFAGLDVLLLTALLQTNSSLISNSQLAPRVLAYNDELLGFVPPQVKQLYYEKRDQLYHLWAENARKMAPPSR